MEKKYIQTRIHFDVIEQENVIISNKHWKQKMIFFILGFGALHNTREVTIKSVSVFFSRAHAHGYDACGPAQVS